MTVPVAMIAAVGANGVIGSGSEIPWRLPTDFAHFKRTTLGKPLIMGRKTFESIGRPLPGRANIVVTRRPDYRPEGVVVAPSLAGALETAQQVAAAEHAEEVMIGGGGEIYREAMPLAQRLYVTHVHAAPDGDAYFPAIDPSIWEVESVLELQRSERDSAEFSVKVYRRRQGRVR
ncbi:MAG: dihydrofolate reductase [Devosia sp.]|uniref:dihydrofolate reductase n=1 Tax=Devosia sp. TaxID=1871048 RepID=UPI001AC83C50|nr:dihydrofolate reductase [Devosia sp.]MBN9315995.1 dihydrofolate reductase [Devosia sp.]